MDNVVPRPPLSRKRTSGKSWIYDLPDFGVTKLKRVKSIATDLAGKVDEAWLSKESLVPNPSPKSIEEPKTMVEGNESESPTVLNSFKIWNEEREESVMKSDSEETESPKPIVTLLNTMETERLRSESLDYGKSESPDLSNPENPPRGANTTQLMPCMKTQICFSPIQSQMNPLHPMKGGPSTTATTMGKASMIMDNQAHFTPLSKESSCWIYFHSLEFLL